MSNKNIQMGIQSINNHLVRMALMAEHQIKESVKALLDKDLKLAELVKDGDQVIDDLQKVIEDQAIRLIATQQPVASDLRTLFTTIKIVTDVERMADYAVDIARIAILLKDVNYDFDTTDIKQMGDTVTKMLRESIDAYTTKDDDKAYEVTRMDDLVDENLSNLVKDLYFGEEAKHSDEKDRLVISQLNFVAKYLERIGDHATNICEWTIYIVTGEYVELNI